MGLRITNANFQSKMRILLQFFFCFLTYSLLLSSSTSGGSFNGICTFFMYFCFVDKSRRIVQKTKMKSQHGIKSKCHRCCKNILLQRGKTPQCTKEPWSDGGRGERRYWVANGKWERLADFDYEDECAPHIHSHRNSHNFMTTVNPFLPRPYISPCHSERRGEHN